MLVGVELGGGGPADILAVVAINQVLIHSRLLIIHHGFGELTTFGFSMDPVVTILRE